MSRPHLFGAVSGGFLLALILCGSFDVPEAGAQANPPPEADAGMDQTVTAGDTVTLNGTGSTGNITVYRWQQVMSETNFDFVPGGLVLFGPSPTFIAPEVTTTTVIYIVLRVENLQSRTFDTDVVAITVTPEESVPVFSRQALSQFDGRTYTYFRGRTITRLVLPAATGGNGQLRYTLTSALDPPLPPGLTFEPSRRTLSGRPTMVRAAAVYTYRATDVDDAINAPDDFAELTFTLSVNEPLSTDASLSGLAVTPGGAVAGFDPGITSYNLQVPGDTTSLTLTPTAGDNAATITVQGAPVASGTASAPINLTTGANIIDIVVTAEDGSTRTYTLVVTRAAPAVPTLTGAVFSIAENTSLGARVGAPLRAANFPAGDARWRLLTANSPFSIDAGSGQLSVAAALDHETAPRHTLTIQLTRGGETATANVTIRVTNVNEAPLVVRTLPDRQFTVSDASITLDLNAYFRDPDGDGLTYTRAIVNRGSASATLSGAELTITPLAQGRSMVTVTAEDGGGLTAVQTFTVTIRDDADDEMVTLRQYLQTTSASVNETELHIVNSRVQPQAFTGSLFARSGEQLGESDQPLGMVAANGRLILRSVDLEAIFDVPPWSGPAMLEVTGIADFSLMSRLRSPSGLVSNTNCVREGNVLNIEGSLQNPAEGSLQNRAEGSLQNRAEGSLQNPAEGSLQNPAEGSLQNPAEGSLQAEGSDSPDRTYVRFINVTDEALGAVSGTLYDAAGAVLGTRNALLLESVAPKAQVFLTRDDLARLAGAPPWAGEAMLVVRGRFPRTADGGSPQNPAEGSLQNPAEGSLQNPAEGSGLKLLNLNLVADTGGGTFFNFSCFDDSSRDSRVYLQTTSTSRNVSLTHIVNTSALRQRFTGTLYAAGGVRLGAAGQALGVVVAANGRLILSSADLERIFDVPPWSGPAMLEVRGSESDFALLTKLRSPSGLVSNTNCVRRDEVHNLVGTDSADRTYIRFINIGEESLRDIRGTLYDSAGEEIGRANIRLLETLAPKAQVFLTRDELAGLAGDTWQGTASLKIGSAPAALRLLNLNLVNNETFFNFSCYEERRG